MSIWQTLQLEPTTDIRAIKSAYCERLKHTPSENNSAILQRLGYAYETALKQALQQADSQASIEAPLTLRQDPLVFKANIILQDPARRCNPAVWQRWREQYQLVSPLRQQVITQQLIDSLAPYNHWLIGDIYDILTQTCDWRSQTHGQNDNQNPSLQQLRRQVALVDIASLPQMSHIEQYALLSVLTPLSRALHDQDIASLRQLLRQHHVMPVNLSRTLQANLLRLYSATNHWPANLFLPMVTELLANDDGVSIETWQQLTYACLQQQWHISFYACIDKLLSLNEFNTVATLLMQWNLSEDPQLALALAHLVQRWEPKPLAYWRHERRLIPAEKDHDEAELNLLYQDLLGQGLLPHLQIDEQRLSPQGMTEQMLSIHLISQQGTVAHIRQIISATQDTIDHIEQVIAATIGNYSTKGTRIWFQLAHLQLQQLLDYLNASPQIIALLEGQLSLAPTADLIATLTKGQWLQLVYRYPTLPPEWLAALKQQKILPDCHQPFAAIGDFYYQHHDERTGYCWYIKEPRKTPEIRQKLALYQYNCAQHSDTPQDAVNWLILAAENGHADAQYEMACRYHQGKDVEQDDAQALNWYTQAAAQGNIDAMVHAGRQFEQAQGTPQDLQKAFKYYLQAAKAGHLLGQYYLANMYHKGEYVLRDDRQALHWYEQSAAQQHRSAQFMLGQLYHYGQGIETDETLARHWYQQAAAQGCEDAVTELQLLAKITIPPPTTSNKPKVFKILNKIMHRH